MPDYLKELMKKVKERKAAAAARPEIEEIKKGMKETMAEEAKEAKPEKEKKPEAAEKKEEAAVKKAEKPAKPAPPPEVPEAPAKPGKAPVIAEEGAAEAIAAAAAEAELKEAPPAKSETEERMEKVSKSLIDSYGEIKIYKVKGEALLYYQVPVPRPTGPERSVISTIKEAATRLISIAPYRIRNAQERRNVYYQRVMDILRESPELRIPERRWHFYADAVVRDMVGYGLIDSLVKDDKLEEIMVIGPNKPVYIYHRQYEMMTTNVEFYSDKEIQDMINRMARLIGRRVDISSPLLDARLPDGSRVNATIPPASVEGSTLTVRKFRTDPFSIIDLINTKTVSVELAAFLWLCVEGMGVKPANILIAGGTGSGKTTTLNVLASFVPTSERVVTIEDTAELNLPLKHWIRMEAKPPGLEGAGELTLDILTKNSLRMRPDRIIVGEIRHDEAFSLFTAMNTGHDGCLGTVHANSPRETIVRLTSPPMSVPEVMMSGLDFILVENRIHDRKKGTIRRVTEVAELRGVLEGKIKTQTVFEWNAPKDTVSRTKVPVAYLTELEKFTGLNKKSIAAEVADRARFLKALAKEGVRNITEVSARCEKYLQEKRGAGARS
jgi:flagellar protein FlaI